MFPLYWQHFGAWMFRVQSVGWSNIFMPSSWWTLSHAIKVMLCLRSFLMCLFLEFVVPCVLLFCFSVGFFNCGCSCCCCCCFCYCLCLFCNCCLFLFFRCYSYSCCVDNGDLLHSVAVIGGDVGGASGCCTGDLPWRRWFGPLLLNFSPYPEITCTFEWAGLPCAHPGPLKAICQNCGAFVFIVLFLLAVLNSRSWSS